MDLTYNKYREFKYLSIFIERIIPEFWQSKYPKFTLFIKYFFQYLEQNGKTYHDIAHIMDFVDIEAIGALTQTGDDLERREQLLRQVYIQYLGSENATALVELLNDEIGFIENQKYINSRTGIKANFLYVFLLALGGYFEITEIEVNNKIHDGTYRYDGLITYDNEMNGVVPFVYMIISQFNKSKYQALADNLNPAGMKYVTLFQQHFEHVISGPDETNISTVYNYSYVYFGIYNASSCVGIVKPFRVQYAEITTGTSYDFMFQDKTKVFLYDTLQTGADCLFYECAFNTSFFTGIDFDSVRLLKNTTVDGNPANDIWYDGAGYTITGDVVYTMTEDGMVQVEDNTQVALLVKGF